MFHARIALLAGLPLLLAACPNDTDSVSIRRGVVDEGALTQGVVVVIAGNIGTVTVPFEASDPVPDVDVEDFQDELDGAVSLLVASVLSGSSADLGAGTPLSDIGGTPSAPGEFTWEFNTARTQADMIFFNETPSGLTLKAANPYNAQFSIMPNDYVEALSAISFGVTVTGG